MAMSRCRDVPAETGPTKKRPPFLERKKTTKTSPYPRLHQMYHGPAHHHITNRALFIRQHRQHCKCTQLKMQRISTDVALSMVGIGMLGTPADCAKNGSTDRELFRGTADLYGPTEGTTHSMRSQIGTVWHLNWGKPQNGIRAPPNTWFLGPRSTQVHNPNGFSIGSPGSPTLAKLMAVSNRHTGRQTTLRL